MKYLLIITLFISNWCIAQSKTEFTLTLKDGNVVTGTTKVSNLILQTDFGKLDVPIKNVSSIELGIKPDLGQKENITNLAKQLLNSNEEMRSKAYNSLISLSSGAIPVLEDVIFSGTYESSNFTDYTLTNALSELKAVHGISSNYKTKDVVFIDYEYNMGGTYEFSSIELKTAYGVLTIPREKIQKIDVMYFDQASGDSKAFKLMAATHISSNANGGWLKTGIMVKPGQTLIISATGEVTLASLSGNKYKPDGSVKNTNAESYIDNYNSGTNYPSYGNVVFKIGENGTSTKAGANYSAKVTQSGMLYLSIHETVYNASNAGFYTVNVNIK
ncbi:MAG: hypothetical protein KF732_05200 [Flavobacteriales bacterium]|jgi:hypothetical protein|nr:hypothetical protein [Flavobacteriales bacterium]MBX2959336.1 hypothetical protein [Flavobacteriales bacterium]